MSDLESEIEAFLVENKFNSVGRLSVLLYVANKMLSFDRPFSVARLLTEQGGQISGLNGQSVQSILARLGVVVPLKMLGEAGRTNRGSVRSAGQFIDWINSRSATEGLDSGELRVLEKAIGKRIAGLLDKRARLYNSLPTSDPHFPGPKFEVRDEKFAIKKGRVFADEQNFAVVAKMTRQLGRIVSELEVSFSTVHNSYHILKSLISKYGTELRREGADLDISALYFLGLQIEAQIDAVGNQGSEDPPFGAERGASLAAWRAAHGTLIAFTPEGEAFITAAAAFQERRVDLASFRIHATRIAEQASLEGVIDAESAETIKETAEFSGKGRSPRRSAILGILTSNAFLSAVFATILTDYLLPGAGKLTMWAVEFIKLHSSDLLELAASAHAYFWWLIDAVSWLLGVG